MITIKNTKKTHLIVKINGQVIDECILADGNPNVRVLDVDIAITDILTINGQQVEISSNDLICNLK
jgi:hypothetical protein